VNQASTLPSIGDRIDGKFRIERKLGEGGTSTVFAVRHAITDKQFAIKWLSPELAKNELAVERFVHEAKICGRYAHPNAVEIYDICRTDASIYLLMELLEGESLESRLKRVERFSVREACDILLPCTEALGAAHELGIVHRDLKPSNIFLCSVDGRPGEVPKVLDFGISKLSRNGHDASPVTTTTRTVIGTPHYMAPEQMRGHPADPRFDVYALGVVLYELVAGRPPFQSDTFADLVFRILEAQSLRLDHVAQAEPEFADIVARAMARDAWDRFPSMAELARALRPYGSQSGACSSESHSSPGYEVTSTGVRRSATSEGAVLPSAPLAPSAPRVAAAQAASLLAPRDGQIASAAQRDASGNGAAQRDASGNAVAQLDASGSGVAQRDARGPAIASRDARGPRASRVAGLAPRDVRTAGVAPRDARGPSVAPRELAQPLAAARASSAPPAALAQPSAAPAVVRAAAPLTAASAFRAACSENEVREVTETSRVVSTSARGDSHDTPFAGVAMRRAAGKRVLALGLVLAAVAVVLAWQLRSRPAVDSAASKPVQMQPVVLRPSTRPPPNLVPAQAALAPPAAPVPSAVSMDPKLREPTEPVAKRAPARTKAARRAARSEPSKPVASAPGSSAAAAAPLPEAKPRIEREDFVQAQRGLALPATELSRQDF
jgi:eukaryotic-like serine/threonine-protein kinase